MKAIIGFISFTIAMILIGLGLSREVLFITDLDKLILAVAGIVYAISIIYAMIVDSVINLKNRN